MSVKRKDILVGLSILCLVMGSFLVSTYVSTSPLAAKASGEDEKTRASPEPGQPQSWWAGVGSSLYTPILVDFGGDTEIEVVVGDNDMIRCYKWDGTLLWTAATQGGIHNSPTIADLDGDGEVEVTVFSEYENALIALNAQGQRLWTHTLPGGIFGSTAHHSAPSGDLDGDGKLESLVVGQGLNVEMISWTGGKYGNNDGDIGMTSLGWHTSPVIINLDDNNETNEYFCGANNGQIIAVNSLGARIWTWNGGYGGFEESSPGAGDLDGDGYNEIFANTEVNGGHHVICLDHNGNLKWVFEGGDAFYSSPAGGDLDGDGYAEVIAASIDHNVYCINGTDGTLKWKADLGYKIKPSPALGDLDGNGVLDVIAVNSRGVCFALNGSNGQVMWSYDPGASQDIPDSSIYADPSPVVGDINSDGSLDVLFSDGDGVLHVLGTEGACAPSALTWPMFRYCREHTGFYNGTLQYGVLLRPDEDKHDSSPLVHFVDPGSYTTFYLEMVNVGHQSRINGVLKDKFTLYIDDSSYLPNGWYADINAYQVPINHGSVQTDTPQAQDFVGVGIGEKISDVQLEEQESLKFELNVHAPVSGVHYGDHAYVNVTAYSQTDPGNATDSITTISIINITIDFEVKFQNVDENPFTGEKEMEIGAGEKVTIVALVRNLGNINDTINVNLSIESSNWHAYFYFDDTGQTFTSMSVDLTAPVYGEYFRTFDVVVEAPNTAMQGEEVRVYIEGESTQAEIVGKTMPPKEDYVVFTVKATDALDLSCDEDTKYFNPGETKLYEINVRNKGNSEITVHFSILGSYNDPYSGYWDPLLWNASLESGSGATLTSLTLRVNQVVSIYLRLQAPLSAPADSRVILSIKGFVAADTSIKDTVDITGIVNKIYGVDVSIDDNQDSVKPGEESKEFEFTVVNTGNADDTIMLSPVDIPNNWEFTFYQDEYEVESLDLGPGESETLSVVIRPSENAVVDADPDNPGIDPYTIIFNVTAGGGKAFKQFSIVIGIQQMYDVAIKCLDPKETSDPGSTVSFLFQVENNGNWFDDVTVHLPDSIGENGWYGLFDYVATSKAAEVEEGVDFTQPIDISAALGEHGILLEKVRYFHNGTKLDYGDITIRMAPKQVAYVSLGLGIPRTAESKENSWTITVSSGGNEDLADRADNAADFSVKIAKSDVEIVDISYPSSIEEGEIVTFVVTVKNVGSYPAENVDVQIKIDGKVIGTVTIRNIPVNETKVATFTWRATGGNNHKIEVQLDPENTLAEGTSGESNNKMDVKINVKKKGLFGLPGFEAYIMAVAMLFAVLVYSRKVPLKK